MNKNKFRKPLYALILLFFILVSLLGYWGEKGVFSLIGISMVGSIFILLFMFVYAVVGYFFERENIEGRFLLTFLIFFGCIIAYLDYTYVDNFEDFIKNLLVEVNGLIIEVVLLSLLYYYFKKTENDSDTFNLLREELEDYRGWNNEFSTMKIVNIIRRSTKQLKQTATSYPFFLNLNNCYLKDADLSGLAISSNLKDANLKGAKLEGAVVRDKDWIEQLEHQNIIGYQEILNQYYIDIENPHYVHVKTTFFFITYNDIWALPVYEIKKKKELSE